MGKFVTAVNAAGNKQTIPTHWLDHPTIGKAFRLPPSQRPSPAPPPASPATPVIPED